MYKRRLYIVEGECEENFFNICKRRNMIRPGKIAVFNLMQKRLTISDNIVSKKYDTYVCCVDTDVVEKDNLQCLISNLILLAKIGDVMLIVQNKKFEDELQRIAGRVKFDRIAGGCVGHALKKKLIKEKYSWISRENHLKYYGSEFEGFRQCVKNMMRRDLKINFITGDNL